MVIVMRGRRLISSIISQSLPLTWILVPSTSTSFASRFPANSGADIRQLHDLGYTTVEAENGARALELTRRKLEFELS